MRVDESYLLDFRLKCIIFDDRELKANLYRGTGSWSLQTASKTRKKTCKLLLKSTLVFLMMQERTLRVLLNRQEW